MSQEKKTAEPDFSDTDECLECDGTGSDGDVLFPRPCRACDGKGYIVYGPDDRELDEDYDLD